MTDSNGQPSVRRFNYQDFTDKKVLGEGSFNQVYLVKHPDIGRCVVKIVSRSFCGKDRQKKKLEAEAATLFSLEHEHLLHGHGIVIESAHLCLVYEHAEYGALTDALRRVGLTWPLKKRIAYQITLALCYLHGRPEPVFHRNLKSCNVLLTKDFNVKVSDFLLPKNTNWMMQATQHKEITERRRRDAGDPIVERGSAIAHIPPESIRNINMKATAEYDMYSYGVIVWEMLTNKQPYPECTPDQVFKMMSEGKTLPIDELLQDYPLVLFDIMDQAFNYEPSTRPQFPDVRDKLKPFCDECSAKAVADAIECKQLYERYRVIKRGRLSTRGSETQLGRPEVLLSQSSSGDNRAFFESAVATSKHQFESESPQLMGTSAAVSTTRHQSVPAVASQFSASMQTTTKAFQELDSESDEEMNDVSKPSTKEEAIDSYEERMVTSSYEEQANSKLEATPFNDHSPPAEPVTRQTTANLNIQGSTVNIQIGDDGVMNVVDDELIRPAPQVDVNALPSRYSQRQMVQSDIFKVSDNVGGRWKRLARCMGLTDPQIDTINHDYHMDGLTEKIYQTMRKWQQKNGGSVTISQLIEVLGDAGLSDVARLLSQ